MKQTTTTKIGRLLVVCLWMLMSYSSYAQNPSYELYVTNQSQVDSKTYQFDVYLLRTGSTDLVLYGMQFGLGVDTSITNGGTLTFSYVTGSSQLNSSQTPAAFQFVTTTFNVGGVIYRYMNQAAVAASQTQNPTTISGVKTGCSSPGTRIGTYRLTNTVDFKQASTCKHIFSGTTAASGRTATKVSAWVNGAVVDITAGTTNGGSSVNYAYNTTGSCDQNLSLNGCAVVATVAPSAVTCFGGSNGTAAVSLSGLGSSSTGSYTVDGGSSVSYSTNPFVVSGLSAGTHYINITSGNCSASTGNFTVNGPSSAITSSFSTSACSSYALPWGGSVTTSGVYTHTYTSAAGCDSTVTANVTIKQTSSSSSSASACGSYVWNGTTYNTSGVKTWTGTNAAGCDSVATLNLTIKQATSSSSTASACGSYVWNGTTYNTSGVKTYTTTNAAGCDSVATLNLTIKQATSSSSSASACISYTWHGTTYSTSGVKTYTTTNAVGCDSVVTLNLTITPQPQQPSIACYQTATFNNSTCSWDVTGTQPAAPTGLACYQTATFNNSTCSWDVTGSQPAAPTGLACYQTATFNTGTCSWDVTGTQPAAPTGLACYQTATFNNSTCSWDVTGSPITSSFSDAACYSYTLPWGTTVTSSGAYSYVYTSARGCDSTVTANITINTATSSTTNYAACISSMPYLWNGVLRTSAGTYTYSTTNANGCDSVATLILTVSTVTPGAPTAVTQTLVSNICGARVYRYAVTAVANAVGYAWVLPTSVGGVSGVTVDSGDITRDRVIRIMYASNAAAIAGDSIKVRAWSGCGNSATKGFKLTNALLAVPAAPTAVTITSVDPSNCGAKIYRYSAPALTSGSATVAPATGWFWSFTGSLGANAVIDSGDVNSQKILVRFTSTAAAGTGDSVKVAYLSLCGNSPAKAAKLTNVVTTAPLVPASITITPVITNVCGNRVYRYIAPTLPVATATASAATGYVWAFVGTLGNNAVIDSGNINSQKLVVHYTLNSAAATGDSVKLYYTSTCGNSPVKALKLTNAAFTVPAAPTAITITAVAPSVCGAKVYRYAAPATLPAATTTATAATGWLWSFTGTLGANASIDSGNVNSKVILVSFTSNAAAGTGDSVRLAYLSDCGNSLNKSSKLTNVVTGVPAAPTAITITPIQTNVCGARRYRYAAPALVPAATATLAAPTGWLWSFTGTLGGNAVIDSGDVNSKVITVSYTSNAAAATGDSVKLQYLSSCGNSLPAKLKLTNTALATPTPATAPTIQTVIDICGDRRYRYTAPGLVAATATAPAATGWLWSFTGTLGGNAVIDSGDVSSQVIVVRFTVYTGAATGDSVRVAYVSDCGTGANKSTKLSNLAKTCVTPGNLPVTKAVSTPAESMSVKVFPNPTTSNFNLQVITAGKEEVTARVLDMQGRFLKSVVIAPNRTMNIGSDLRAGSYFIEVRQGKEVKTTRVIKF